jgi:hypothetical protein
MKYLLLLLLLVSCNTEEIIQPRSSADLIFNPDYPCKQQRVAVTFDNGHFNNCGTSKIEVYIGGTWITAAQRTPVDGVITTTFTPTEAGEYLFRASWRGGGKTCRESHVKYQETLIVVDDCCRDYLTADGCFSDTICQYRLEFSFMLEQDNWVNLTGIFPEYVELCGFYDENNNLVQPMSGSIAVIEGDVYGCQEMKFFIYFNSPRYPENFGTWNVHDMVGKINIDMRPNVCQ